jgi:hypothetical protein
MALLLLLLLLRLVVLLIAMQHRLRQQQQQPTASRARGPLVHLLSPRAAVLSPHLPLRQQRLLLLLLQQRDFRTILLLRWRSSLKWQLRNVSSTADKTSSSSAQGLQAMVTKPSLTLQLLLPCLRQRPTPSTLR